jgi:transcription antitermination protein NusB
VLVTARQPLPSERRSFHSGQSDVLWTFSGDSRYLAVVTPERLAVLAQGTPEDVVLQQLQAREPADLAYFEDLVRGVGSQCRQLDEALAPYLDRGIEEVDAIERAMLRIAAYELLHRLDVPYRVVIDEALNTVKRFGSEHGHTYVNGVLDRAAAQWRSTEAQSARP